MNTPGSAREWYDTHQDMLGPSTAAPQSRNSMHADNVHTHATPRSRNTMHVDIVELHQKWLALRRQLHQNELDHEKLRRRIADLEKVSADHGENEEQHAHVLPHTVIGMQNGEWDRLIVELQFNEKQRAKAFLRKHELYAAVRALRIYNFSRIS